MPRPWRTRALVAILALTACQAPAPTPPGTPPPTTLATVSPAAVSPVPVGAARTTVLNAAGDAFSLGDYASAAELYSRVLGTPPAGDESAELTRDVDGLARFRLMLADVLLARDDQARQQLQLVQGRDPTGVWARLAAQFLDQYGMAGSARAACSTLAQQVPTQAAAELERLAQAGVRADAATLCSVPA